MPLLCVASNSSERSQAAHANEVTAESQHNQQAHANPAVVHANGALGLPTLVNRQFIFSWLRAQDRLAVVFTSPTIATE